VRDTVRHVIKKHMEPVDEQESLYRPVPQHPVTIGLADPSAVSAHNGLMRSNPTYVIDVSDEKSLIVRWPDDENAYPYSIPWESIGSVSFGNAVHIFRKGEG